jgi:hypothetical protein
VLIKNAFKQKLNLTNFYTMAVQQEIWVRYIIQRLWKDNTFLTKAMNEDQYVVGGRIVHIPQPGAKPVVQKNRAVYPGVAVRRTDGDITYNLDEYTTDPTHIVDADKVELSYDKINSVFGDHAGTLVETIADDYIIKWLNGIPAANIIRTTGTGAAATTAGQTGLRKVFVHDDLRKGKLILDLQKVPSDGRFALLEANMADQLFASLSNTQYRDFSQYADAKEGIIGRLYGFNIMNRSEVAMASVANAINPLGAAITATDNVASICWHKDFVTRAMGEKKFFENPNRAEFYGDIYSALIRGGGRRRREDNAGVVAILQDAAA